MSRTAKPSAPRIKPKPSKGLALMDFDDACKSAQRWEIRESFAYSPGERGHNVAVWRGALMRQLLTPAPDGRAIEWKRRTFASGQHEHTDTKPERIERESQMMSHFLRRIPCVNPSSRTAQSSQRRQNKPRFAEWQGMQPSLHPSHHHPRKN